MNMMIRGFFTAPFEYRRLPSEEGVGFDVLHCPVAEYFEARGVPELTPHYCKTDYFMAREWGMELNGHEQFSGRLLDWLSGGAIDFHFPAVDWLRYELAEYSEKLYRRKPGVTEL